MIDNQVNFDSDILDSGLSNVQKNTPEEGHVDVLDLDINQAFVYKQILSLCLKTQKRLDELRATLQQVSKISNEQLGKDNSGSGFSKKDILDKRDASDKIDAKIVETQRELQKIVETLMKIPILRSSRVQGFAIGLNAGGSGSDEEDLG